MTTADQAALIVERRKLSFDWQRQNFYDQWRKVHRLYKCEVDPAQDENTGASLIVDPNGRRIPGSTDPTKTRVGMPDTWSLVQRQVARITAQPPNLKFRADDLDLAKNISRKLMHDWDRGEVQRTQKRHVAQAALFGISIRAWSWETLEYPRTRRVDPLSSNLDDGARTAIHNQYDEQLRGYQEQVNAGADLSQQEAFGGPTSMAMLMGDHSRGNLLPIRENYKKYEGPKAHFLFIGDCFFQPNFQELQSSKWFIVERRRDRPWLTRMAKRYEQLAFGIDELFRRFPKGSQNRTYTHDAQSLRTSMMGDIDRIDNSATGESNGSTEEWTITEQWTPGAESKACFVGEDSVYVGEIEQPYDLDGKIPFTELRLIDDILSGIGDSHARIIRGLNELHNDQVSLRSDLYSNILRPLYFTNDQYLYDNPGLLKRGDGFRLVFSRNPNAVQPMNEGPALASAAASISGTEEIMRQIQMASGESNMSMAANIDPQQNRTATGARLTAFNQDILSKSATDMFNLALNDDATMMYLLNRSEMPESVTFDAARYTRSYVPGMGAPQQPQAPPELGAPAVPPTDPMTVSPLDFQIDGEVEAEVGSTLADDDQEELVKAQNVFAMAVANPGLINQQKAVQNLLIRFGYAKELAQWQPPPPAPIPPEPAKVSLSISVKFETLPLDVQVALLQKGLIEIPPEKLAAAQLMQDGIDPEIAQGPETPTPTMTIPPPTPPVVAGKPPVKPNGAAPAMGSAPPPPSALDAAQGIRPTQ